MARLSVLLCTRNRPEKVERAVASILENSFRDFELIVVDQSMDERTSLAMQSFHDPRLRYIRTSTVGLARARNIAIRASQSETLVFTDDDCICERDWLASIVEEYEADPGLEGVFGRVVPYGGERENMFCPAVFDSTERRVVDRPVIPAAVLGGGNNMSFKKQVFARIGLFVETLGAGTWLCAGEDTEFIYRALSYRMRFAYSPKPLVHHDNWMSEEEFARLMQGSILGGTAVFTKYALTTSGPALFYLVRVAYYVLRDRFGAGSVFQGVWHYAVGFFLGFKYLFISPPKLPRTAAGD